jgi:hypothetical protein
VIEDDNVVSLGVCYRGPLDADNPPVLTLAPKDRSPCMFRHKGPYLIDEKLAEVECGTCHARLNPMHVLGELARQETQWHNYRRSYHDQLQRLRERSRTKCEKCGQMTRISDR